MVSTDLRHPDLRWRDVRHILQLRNADIVWDPGFEPRNPWIYTSVEDKAHRERLLQWLQSKDVPSSSDAFLFGDYENALTTVTWGDLLAEPQKFFGRHSFEVVSKSLEWKLDHQERGVSRFGRWHATI